MPVIGDDKLEDNYNLDKEVDKKTLLKSEDDKRDLATIKREEFLNIYKGEKDDLSGDEVPDLSDGIKIKPESL